MHPDVENTAAERRHRIRSPRWDDLTAVPFSATPRLVTLFLGLVWTSAGSVLLVLAGIGLLGGTTLPVPASAAGGGAALLVSAVWWRSPHRPRAALHLTLLVALGIVAGLVAAIGEPGTTGSATAYVLVLLVAVSCTSWLGAWCYAALTAALVVGWQVVHPADWAHTIVTCWALLLGMYVVGRLLRAASAAEVDGLTGLVNRRGAERHLERLAAAASQQPAAAAVIDLDHFKAVNDQQGHAAGDELLRRVASALHGAARQTLAEDRLPLVARWGGDEFVLAAAAAPERLVATLDLARALLPEGASCSAGVAGLRAGDPPSAALARADEVLYAVKRGERGRTATAEEPPDAAPPAVGTGQA